MTLQEALDEIDEIDVELAKLNLRPSVNTGGGVSDKVDSKSLRLLNRKKDLHKFINSQTTISEATADW